MEQNGRAREKLKRNPDEAKGIPQVEARPQRTMPINKTKRLNYY